MKLDYIAPLVISNAIEYLKTRPVGTMYHPGEYQYILDGKTVAKIIRHDCNLRASVDGDETTFFQRVLKHALNMPENMIYSVINNEKYKLREYSKFGRFSIMATHIKRGRILKGSQPKYIEGGKYVPVGYD